MIRADRVGEVQPETKNPQMEQYDVAVVGAGPAGSVAAERIAAAGWRVVLLEKSEYPGKDSVCGGMISLKQAEIFQIDPTLIEKDLRKSACYYPWGSLEMRYPATLGNSLLTVQRKSMDRFLAGKAVRSGAELRTQCRVMSVRRVATGRMVVHLSEGKTEKELASRLVVFADGPLTLARRCFGIGFEAKPSQTAVSMIFDFEYPDNPMDYYDAYYVCEAAPPSFGWSFPFSNHVNFGLLIPRYEMDKKKHLFKNVLDLMLQHYSPSSSLIKNRKLIRKRGAFLPMRPARRIHDDSCLVVGDAAGLVSPLTGVGIPFAMHSGLAAAETAIEALRRGDFSAKILSHYPRRWRKSKKHRKLQVSVHLFRVISVLQHVDPQVLNKFFFSLNLLLSQPDGESLRLKELVRVLLFPLLGNPDLRIRRTGKSLKGSSPGMLQKGT